LLLEIQHGDTLECPVGLQIVSTLIIYEKELDFDLPGRSFNCGLDFEFIVYSFEKPTLTDC
jgi:hypothetical protein